ncbi:MAG: MFS transporter [Sulfolobales archaeon]
MISLIYRSFYLALLSALDLVFVLFFTLYLGVDAKTLGLIGMLWSLVYIVVSLVSNKLGDRGLVGVLAVISSLAFISLISILLTFSRIYLFLVLGYMLHSIATATARVSNTVSINESYYFEEWSRAITMSQVIQRFVYAIILLVLVFGSVNILFVAGIIPYILISFILPLAHEFRGFERRYSSIVSKLETLNHVSRFTVVTLDSNTRISYDLFNNRFNHSISKSRLLLSIFLSATAIETLMFPIPAFMKSFLTLRDILLIYVILGLANGFALLLTRDYSGNKHIASLFRVIAIIILFLSLTLPRDISTIALLGVGFALNSVFNNMFVIEITKIYNSISYGYGSGVLIAFLELGALAGDIFLWLYLGGVGYSVIIILAGIIYVVSSLLVAR